MWLIMDKVRIQFEDSMNNLFYLYKRKDGTWNIASRSGISESFSNFSKDPMLLKFALNDAQSAKAALEALKKYTRAINPYVLGDC